MFNVRAVLSAAAAGAALAGSAVLLVGCTSGAPPAPPAAATTVAVPPPPKPLVWPATAPLSPELRAAWENGRDAQPTEEATTEPVADRCTNQIDYSGDPRSNAEINSLGTPEDGTCPDPISGEYPPPGEAYDPEGEYDPRMQRDVNGETYYDYCSRTGQSVEDCNAG